MQVGDRLNCKKSSPRGSNGRVKKGIIYIISKVDVEDNSYQISTLDGDVVAWMRYEIYIKGKFKMPYFHIYLYTSIDRARKIIKKYYTCK